MCIRLSDGEVLWESRVGDRIESSAALSTCGKYVIVGEVFGCFFVFVLIRYPILARPLFAERQRGRGNRLVQGH